MNSAFAAVEAAVQSSGLLLTGCSVSFLRAADPVYSPVWMNVCLAISLSISPSWIQVILYIKGPQSGRTHRARGSQQSKWKRKAGQVFPLCKFIQGQCEKWNNPCCHPTDTSVLRWFNHNLPSPSSKWKNKHFLYPINEITSNHLKSLILLLGLHKCLVSSDLLTSGDQSPSLESTDTTQSSELTSYEKPCSLTAYMQLINASTSASF